MSGRRDRLRIGSPGSMTQPRHLCGVLVSACALVVLLPSDPQAQQAQQPEPRKPSIVARATPPVGFTPMRVRVSAELREGSDDFADFYCPTVEWEWGDGTTSENSSDCEPYEAGKSVIQRRFSAEHTYRQGGAFRITFKLKQKTKQVGSASATIQVRMGAGDPFGR